MVAKYQIIYQQLLDHIKSGKYSLGSLLPAETELAAKHSVNRHTVRRSLSMLMEEGYIERTPGKGSVVIAYSKDMAGKEVQKVKYRFPAKLLGEKQVTGAIKIIADKFMESNSDIEIILEPYDFVRFELSSGMQELFGGPVPTVARFTFAADYAIAGSLLPLEKFPDFFEITSPLDSRLLYKTESADQNFHIHSLPVMLGGWAMVCNVSLFKELGFSEEEIPETWSEMKDIFKKIKERGNNKEIRPAEMLLLDGMQTVTRFLPFVYTSNKGELIHNNSPAEIDIKNKGCVRFANLFKELHENGYFYIKGKDASFLNKKSVFRLSATFGGIKKLQHTMQDSEIKLYPVPYNDDYKQHCSIIRGDFSGILKNTIHSERAEEAAWRFLKYLVCEEAQELMCKNNEGAMPVRNDMYPFVETLDKDRVDVFNYTMRYGRSAIDVPKNTEIQNILRRSFVRAILGEVNTEDALSEGQHLVDSYLRPEKSLDLEEYII
ncbi:MAG: extracellular solute-binding protein [Planctomycetota bacterium]